MRSSSGDAFRASISSAPSNSSQGSSPEDCESSGDIFVWGEIWTEGDSGCCKTDVLLPRLLECNVVLDVRQIACGFRHAAVVTMHGEVFSWGEDNGGRLGHGSEIDSSRPQLIESLATSGVDSVSCGEFHSCAVSSSGELYSWGDGAMHAGFLGHGTDISRWIPRKVEGPLEDLQVSSVSCGTWHSAFITTASRLFTFGDGSFGVLGHGDRDSVFYPKEVQSLIGLKTIRVACGVWHTAAIVDIGAQEKNLFTWGDGDHHRLGHGDKESRLIPTCVSSLIDYDFHQLACGNSLTVALTTSGHVFTFGSARHGQLGNPNSDGAVPCLVQDRLVGEKVEEIACGEHHVAALTSRSEVFSWGKGANGRLGHGDEEDRRTPTLIESLRDRHVKSISCGSNFMASICIHKWVSTADQSYCSGCRQVFGFARKRHNCYNCGLVHCHACSSKKILRAAMAPTPGKPHRVCDSCYLKLKAAEVGSAQMESKKAAAAVYRRSIDLRSMRQSRALISSIGDSGKSMKSGSREDSSPTVRGSPVSSSLLQLKDIPILSSISALQAALKPVVTSVSPPSSRSTSPFPTRPSSPRLSSFVFPKSAVDGLKRTNELLNQEVARLQSQVKTLKQRCEAQEAMIQRYERRALEVLSMDDEDPSRLASLGLVKSILPSRKDATGEETKNSRQAAAEEGNPAIAGSAPESPAESKSPSVSRSAYPFLSQTDNRERPQNTSTDSDPRSPRVSSSTNNNNIYVGDNETVEQFEPGVYISVIVLPDGTKCFQRVRFSKRRFAAQQAEEWWKANQENVFSKYLRPIAHKSTSSSSLNTSGNDGDDVPSSSS